MSGIGFLLALLLPGLAAATVLAWLGGRPPQRLAWVVLLAEGYVLGSLLWGGLLRWLPHGPGATFYLSVLGLAVLALAATWAGRRRAALAWQPNSTSVATPAERLVLILGLVLVGLTALATLISDGVLPTLPWDAWTVWMGKAKAWYHAGGWLPTLSYEAWWQSEPGSSRHLVAAHYPEALPRFVLWLALGQGGWDEAWLGLSWWLLWLAGGVILGGHLSGLALPPRHATMAALALLGLPLLLAHASLPGYADLWQAQLLLLVFLRGWRWLRFRQRGDLAVFALAAMALPWVKHEGAVWLFCLLLAGLFGLLPLRWRRWAWVAGALALGLAAVWKLVLPLPGLGWVELRWGSVELSQVGRLDLHWRPVAEPVLESLLLLPNWMLLWPLLVFALWHCRQRLRAGPLRDGGRFMLFGYGFLFLLFFFTDASQWAETLTSLNRVLLHIVPTTVAWLALLLALPPAVRGRWSSVRS